MHLFRGFPFELSEGYCRLSWRLCNLSVIPYDPSDELKCLFLSLLCDLFKRNMNSVKEKKALA